MKTGAGQAPGAGSRNRETAAAQNISQASTYSVLLPDAFRPAPS